MNEPINIREAKARLSSLVARAEAGEEVIIARANRPAVRLVPVERVPTPRRIGEAAGQAVMHDDFDALPDEFMDAFQ